jgi:hypothetical protein
VLYPPAALSISNGFSVKARARWYWIKVTHYDRIIHGLEFEGWSVKRASEDKATFDKEMADLFPKFSFTPPRFLS